MALGAKEEGFLTSQTPLGMTRLGVGIDKERGSRDSYDEN
jgi:hypothetical protein